MRQPKTRIGFLPANRAFFSDALAAEMRSRTIAALRQAGATVVVPSRKDTKIGCVETPEEAVKVGRMFRDKDVHGVLVSAVNFGDEQAVAMTVREAGLNVPIMIVGCQETGPLTPTTQRRDSFCGLLSIGEVLRQLEVPYSVPEVPVCLPTDEGFAGSLERFLAVCRVVGGIRRARYAQVGARPDAFWTCRYNEKALQALGPTVVSVDLSEIFAAVRAMGATAAVRRVTADMKKTLDCSAVDDETLEKIARLELVLARFAADNRIDAMAIQCWTSMQTNLRMCSCSAMARLDDRGIPCACEADVMGAMSMHALQLASGTPSALADWNNLHNDDTELVNCWHCGVFPPSWAKQTPRLGCHEIIAGTIGRENTMGTIELVMADGPVTLCRATHDNAGTFKLALAQGAVEPNPAATFGAYGWVRIPGLDRLYRNVLLRHFPHHVALSRCTVGNVLWEAFGNYLGFETYTAGNPAGRWSPELPFTVHRPPEK